MQPGGNWPWMKTAFPSILTAGMAENGVEIVPAEWQIWWWADEVLLICLHCLVFIALLPLLFNTDLEVLHNTIKVRKEKVYRSERKIKSGLSEDDMIIYVEIWKNQPKSPGTNGQFIAMLWDTR